VVVGALQLRAGMAALAAAAGAVTDAVADGPPTIAVGLIADFRGEGAGPARPLADMLATNLARADGIRVVSRLASTSCSGSSAPPTRSRRIHRRRPPGRRRRAGRRHAVRPARRHAAARPAARGTSRAGPYARALTLEGRDLFALADSGTPGCWWRLRRRRRAGLGGRRDHALRGRLPRLRRGGCACSRRRARLGARAARRGAPPGLGVRRGGVLSRHAPGPTGPTRRRG
jgi:hypothetical protein